MARSGGRWRDLPDRLGDYRSVKPRYYRWIEMGVLDVTCPRTFIQERLERISRVWNWEGFPWRA